MNKEELKEYLNHRDRINSMIEKYELGQLALTTTQVSDMWAIFRDLNNKCPHPEKVERHYVDTYEDEYSSIHSSAHCVLTCRYCDEDVKTKNQYVHGTYCAVTGDVIYFPGGNFKTFNVLIDSKNNRTNIEMVTKNITRHTKYWEPKGPIPPPLPSPQSKKSEYLEKLQALEAASLTPIASQYEVSKYD